MDKDKGKQKISLVVTTIASSKHPILKKFAKISLKETLRKILTILILILDLLEKLRNLLK